MTRLLLASACAALLAPLVSAQTPASPPPSAVYTPTSLQAEPGLPRTPDGRPDFQSAVWATNFFPVFEASPLAATLVVSETESKAFVDTMVKGIMSHPEFNIDPEGHVIIGGTDGLPIVRGERRSRLIVLPADGKVPLTPEAKKIASVSSDEKDDYEQRPSGERCLVLSGAPPAFVTISYNRLQFIQTRDHVVIHGENGDEARIIRFAADHSPAGPATWYGASIARWDGDTLIIETIRQPQGEAIRGLFSKFLVNADAKVIERFTRLSQAELLYQFTVEDPKVYTAPWLAEYSFHASDTGMFPSPCHEHNYSLPNILLGQRMADLKAAKKH
ncbi:MAG: hypothetical protein IPO30_11880 [Hyphomonadaceae bacterium]|nr:hypothetical protein [Hyphomonadaceae bacterium]